MKHRTLLPCLLLALLVGAACPATEITTRPDFASKWYLTIILSGTNSPLDLELERQLREDPTLVAIVQQTNLHIWTEGKSRWLGKTQWKTLLETLPRPVIILQAPSNLDGTARAVFVRAGANIPFGTLAQELMDHSVAFAAQFGPEAVEQCPLTKPKPAPQPDRQPIAPLVETPKTPVADPQADSIPLIFFLLPLAGGLAGMWRGSND